MHALHIPPQPTPCVWCSLSNQKPRCADKTATPPAGSPRHVISRKKNWCPTQVLGTITCSKSEKSSVFPPKKNSACPWLERFRDRKGEETQRPCRIRPLGVTVLSKICLAPTHTHIKHTHTHMLSAKMVSRRGIYCSRTLGSAFSQLWRHIEGHVLHLSSCLQGWMINGRSNNFRAVHKIKFLSETSIWAWTLTAIMCSCLGPHAELSFWTTSNF